MLTKLLITYPIIFLLAACLLATADVRAELTVEEKNQNAILELSFKNSLDTAETSKAEFDALQSLDNLTEQENNDIFIIESQQVVNASNDDMQAKDSFDDLSIQELLSQSIGYKIENKIAEEILINKLDNSDLLDFEETLDIWGSDIIEDLDDIIE